VGDPNAVSGTGAVDVWRGGLRPEAVPVHAPAGEDDPHFGYQVGGGDTDGDGLGELFVDPYYGTGTYAWHYADGGLGGADGVPVQTGLQDVEASPPLLGAFGDLDGDGRDDHATLVLASVQRSGAGGLPGEAQPLDTGSSAQVYRAAIFDQQGLALSDATVSTEVGVGQVWWWPSDALGEPGLPVVPPRRRVRGLFWQRLRPGWRRDGGGRLVQRRAEGPGRAV